MIYEIWQIRKQVSMKLSFNLYTLLISRVQYISIKTYFYVWNMEVNKTSSREIRYKYKYPTSESALGENIKKDTQVMEMLVVDGRNGCLFVWDRLLEAVTLKKPDTDFKHQYKWYSITHLTFEEQGGLPIIFLFHRTSSDTTKLPWNEIGNLISLL